MTLKELIEIMKERRSRCYIQDLYLVVANEDLNEGRGCLRCLGAFEMWSQAESAAKGEGIMGGDADIRRRSAIVIEVENARYCIDTASIQPIRAMSEAEMEAYKQEVTKRAAAKLTAEEREVLGLDKV